MLTKFAKKKKLIQGLRDRLTDALYGPPPKSHVGTAASVGTLLGGLGPGLGAAAAERTRYSVMKARHRARVARRNAAALGVAGVGAAGTGAYLATRGGKKKK